MSGSRRTLTWESRHATRFDPAVIIGPKQLTNTYLLGLAVQHEGRLVTYDARIPRSAVRASTAQHLVVI